MQSDINHLKSDVSEIKSDVKELISTLDERFAEVVTHNSSEIMKLTLEFKEKMDKKADIDKSWAEKVLTAIAYMLLTGIVGAVGYAIVHAYTSK